jgi:hypothetical protein
LFNIYIARKSRDMWAAAVGSAMNRKSDNGHAPALREPRLACTMNRKYGNRPRCFGAWGELGTGRERDGIGLVLGSV